MPEKCGAKMRPFPNDTEIECELIVGAHGKHAAVLRDYAYPGSETTIKWLDSDRRTFYGGWIKCDDPGCILPLGHPGKHAR